MNADCLLFILFNQVSVVLSYKVDTGISGNIMPLHLYKTLFPRARIEQLAATKNKNVQLKSYNKTTITQLGMCKVKLEHNNIQKMCKFFVVPGRGQALLGMPGIDTLNIIRINCNTIGTHRNDTADNCSTNTAIC